MKKKKANDLSMLRWVIFFLDIFLALLIILTASTLLKDPIGTVVVVFGFFMLTLATAMKLMRKW